MKLSKPIIGKDPALQALLRNVQLIAPTNVNVLITGETGTGKELIAVAVQENSLRSDKVFITLNCAALPESLIESELFGYAKGAFTDANNDKQGLFAAADGGTLFLDEINSLPVTVQAKLLRFIESGEYVPVGTTNTLKADARIIAATNCHLDEQVNSGAFRQDLYFRLSVVPLQLPPLRDRPGDINLLTKHFMTYFANKYAVRIPVLSKEVVSILKRHPWPGNIRELSNFCEYLCILKIRKIIGVKDIPSGHLEVFNDSGVVYCFKLPEDGIVWHELEADLIQQALVTANGKLQEASRLLGITRDALAYRIKKYGLSAV
jgi:transcriptional regulator with PAS, ATPase and Fis domain